MKKSLHPAAGVPDDGTLSIAGAPSGGTTPIDVAAALEKIHATLGEIRASVGDNPRPARPWYTVAEIARLTGRGSDTVRRWISGGRLEATRVKGTGPKGRLMVSHDELVRLMGAGVDTDDVAAAPDENARRHREVSHDQR